MADDTKTGEPETAAEIAERQETAKEGMKHFAGTVEKVDADGNRSLSSYVDYDNGEQLAVDADAEAAAEAEKEAADAEPAGDDAADGTGSAPTTTTKAGTTNTVSTSDLLS